MNNMDKHFYNSDMIYNAPILMGLIGWYNTYIAGHSTRAILPYSQALLRFPAHI